MVHESHLPRVLEEIENLFSWNPPLFVRGSKKQSTSSHLPAYYDKHFSAKLVLKRVEQLPSLIQILKDNVDRALEVAKPTLPPLSPSSIFIAAEERRKEKRGYYDLEAKNENAVANFYDKYTSRYCLSLASMLALHPAAPEWTNLLLWTQCSSSGGELRIMTDSLSLDEDTKLHRENAWATMKAYDRHLFELMRDSESSLATWEIKGLGAGTSNEVISSAVRILGTFSWTLCSFDRNECANIKRHRTELEKVDEVVVGHDAKCFPWLPSNTDSESEASTFPPLPPLTETGPPTLPPPSPSQSLFSLPSLTTTGDVEPSPTTNAGKKRKRDGGSLTQDISKKLKRNDTNETDHTEEDNDDNTTKEEEQKAFLDCHDVKQAWAQATRVDGTVIVLHSGNHELICVRHRATQTLYVSNVIEPHKEPGYGKIVVGTYITAIQDALDRMQQSLPESQPKPSGSSGTLIGGDKDHDDNNRVLGSSGRGGPGYHGGKPKGVRKSDGGRKGFTDDEQATIEEMIHEASHDDVVLMYHRYGVYDSPFPATFIRCARPFFPRTTHHPSRPEDSERLAVVLTSEIGQGATGVVHHGTLVPPGEIWDDAIPVMDIVVKLAFDIEQRKDLKKEYKIYRRLKLKGIHRGITTVLGLFDDSEDGARALVMLYSGVPLSEDLLQQGKLTITDCESALSTLKSIHDAGILHGDIRLDNILISESGRITIIDFGHSQLCDDERVKNKELGQLCNLLGLAGKGRSRSLV